jgi:hypothetical protein
MNLPAGIRHYSEELRIKTCGCAEKETHKEQEAPLPQERKHKSLHVRIRGLTSAKYVSGVSISTPPPGPVNTQSNLGIQKGWPLIKLQHLDTEDVWFQKDEAPPLSRRLGQQNHRGTVIGHLTTSKFWYLFYLGEAFFAWRTDCSGFCTDITHALKHTVSTRKTRDGGKQWYDGVWTMLQVVTLRTTRFNTHKFYVLPTQCTYVFRMDLRTNTYYFPTALTGWFL